MEPKMKEIAEWLRQDVLHIKQLVRSIYPWRKPKEYLELIATIESRAAQVEAMGPISAQWKSALDPVMPPDFKDWHENNIHDLPEVAAMVIRNLRERAESAEAQLEAMGESYGKALKLLVDVEMIFPGSAGRGDISREQRTHADVRRFLAKIYPDEYEKKL